MIYADVYLSIKYFVSYNIRRLLFRLKNILIMTRYGLPTFIRFRESCMRMIYRAKRVLRFNIFYFIFLFYQRPNEIILCTYNVTYILI